MTRSDAAQPMADCFFGAEMSFRHRSLELVRGKHAVRAHRNEWELHDFESAFGAGIFNLIGKVSEIGKLPAASPLVAELRGLPPRRAMNGSQFTASNFWK